MSQLNNYLSSQGVSPREIEVTELLTKGLSNKEIANSLGNTEKTVKFHLTNIFKKLNVSKRTQLIVKLQKYKGV